MGMFYGAQLQAMLPKLHSDNFEGMELIRPMYCIHEDDIIRWQRRTTSWNSSSAPAASPRIAPSATTAAAAPSGRRSRCCSSG